LRMAKEYLELQLEDGNADDLEILEYAKAAFTAVGEVEVELPVPAATKA